MVRPLSNYISNLLRAPIPTDLTPPFPRLPPKLKKYKCVFVWRVRCPDWTLQSSFTTGEKESHAPRSLRSLKFSDIPTLIISLTRSELNPFITAFLCPDFLTTGNFSEKTDIFSLGVIMAELLTGKRSVQRKQGGRAFSLIAGVRKIFSGKSGKIEQDLIDPGIKDIWPGENLEGFGRMMISCLQDIPSGRPSLEFLLSCFENLMKNTGVLCLECGQASPISLPCAHSSLCAFCVLYLRTKGTGCPFCRAPLSVGE